MKDESEIYKKQGLGNRLGFGNKAALIIVDFVNGFNDPAIFGGGNIPQAIFQTKKLLSVARVNNIPIAFTRIIYADDGSDAGVFTEKAPKLKTLTRQNPLSQIVPDLSPRAGEYVIDKTEALKIFVKKNNKSVNQPIKDKKTLKYQQELVTKGDKIEPVSMNKTISKNEKKSGISKNNNQIDLSKTSSKKEINDESV